MKNENKQSSPSLILTSSKSYFYSGELREMSNNRGQMS